MRQRFILAPEFMPLAIFNSKKKEFNSSSSSVCVKLTAESASPIDAQCLPTFIGERFGEVKPTIMLDFRVKNSAQGQITTTIFVASKEKADE